MPNPTAVLDEVTKGWRSAVVVCGHCRTVCEHRHHIGQPVPEYCGPRCRNAAKRKRQSTGATAEPQQVREHRACPGCGEVGRLKSRGGFETCLDCRGRLHGACMRKTPYATEQAARDFSTRYNLGQYPYRCSFCALVHLTSEGTADELPGDREFGLRLRAAGFTRKAVR